MRFFTAGLILTFAIVLFTVNGCSLDPQKQKTLQFISKGKHLYQMHCESCHYKNGVDDLNLTPPLAKSDYLLKDPLNSACAIKNGLKTQMTVNGQVYDIPMPAFPKLKADEIAKIICYIGNSWGNEIGFIATEDVKNRLKSCANK